MLAHRNPTWLDGDTINAEVHHPELGWLPITLRADDPDTEQLFRRVADELGERPEAGAPAPPVGIEQLRATADIGKPELLFALHKRLNLISEAEARAAATSGETPEAFKAILAGMPDDERLLAELKWAADPRISRNDRLLEYVATALYGQRGAAVLDALFGLKPLEEVNG